MRLREVKELTQRHTAGKWQKSDLNPVRTQEVFVKRPDLAVGAERAKASWKMSLACCVCG